MKWGKYNLIDSLDKIREVDRYLMSIDTTPNFEYVAYDTETNGLKLHTSVIIGFSFSVNQYQGFYVPLLVWVRDPTSLKARTIKGVKYNIYERGHLRCHWTGKDYPEFVTPEQYEMPEFVPALIDRWFSQSRLIMHNAPFDINMTDINTGVNLVDQLFSDTGLLVHVLNENNSVGLKESVIIYGEDLGVNQYARETEEKKELGNSILINGGKSGHVWRADLEYQSKYACADTFLTYGLHQVVIKRIVAEYGEKALEWIFEQEIMPLCKEVVVDMKKHGVYIDVDHFKKLHEQNKKKLLDLEDEIMKIITPHLDDFPLGKSLDEAISHQRFIKRVAQLENLKIPIKEDKKEGKDKPSLSKGVIKKEYEKNPHWLWGYLLGLDEIKYSEKKIREIKQQLYEEEEGRRYRFNINSNDHLIWLFCDKLGINKKALPKTDKSTAKEPKPSLEADNIKEHILPRFSWVKRLVLYKKISKIQSTYVTPAVELNRNGWLYMDMKQNGTTSGRFSCSGGYNLQTLPKADDEEEALTTCPKCFSEEVKVHEDIEVLADVECLKCGHMNADIIRPSAIKKGFVAPPGYKIINADYSSLEPRCFAYISKEDAIKEVYRKGLDLYSKVYCDIYDKEGKYSADPKAPNYLGLINKKARKFIKPIVLGIPYGAGAAQVANLTGHTVMEKNEDGLISHRPDMDKGAEIRNQYLGRYPNLTEYMNLMEYMAIEYGFVDSMFGRRRHFQHAKFIGTFLDRKMKMNLDKFDKVQLFISSSVKKLKVADVNITSNSGRSFFLSEEDLKELCQLLKINYYSDEKTRKEGIVEKGFWSHIRSLVKADINNAKNHPIQALAGQITNMGMLTTNRSFRYHGINAWVALQVHDEIMCYAREDQSEMARSSLQQGMEDNIFTNPLKSEVIMSAKPIICNSLKESK